MTRRGMNWAADRARDAMRRQGVQSKRDEVPFMAALSPGKPRRPPPKSKEELRAEAARAFVAWRAKQLPRKREDGTP
jgi:hypothetical protein